MALSSVEEVHKQLEYTEADATSLKDVKLVWQRLEGLRKRAARDSSYLQQYRDLLEKSLEQARALRPDEDVEAVIARVREFWLWYQQQYERLGIADREWRRGMVHQEWTEKWLPDIWRHFEAAIGNMNERPSARNIDEAKAAATLMLQRYVAAI